MTRGEGAEPGSCRCERVREGEGIPVTSASPGGSSPVSEVRTASGRQRVYNVQLPRGTGPGVLRHPLDSSPAGGDGSLLGPGTFRESLLGLWT